MRKCPLCIALYIIWINIIWNGVAETGKNITYYNVYHDITLKSIQYRKFF